MNPPKNPLDSQVWEFLKDLAAHNSKDWLDAHRERYHRQKEKVVEFTAAVYNQLATVESLPYLDPKKSVTRINNNRKFHPDKPPYKTHFGVMIKRGEERCDFYIHLEPEGCFIGAGVYHPPRAILDAIRHHIHDTGSELAHIVSQPAFRQMFGGLDGDSLKTAPRDFPKDHPQIELIRRKDFVVMRPMPERAMRSSEVLDQIGQTYQTALPLMQFIDTAMAH